MNYKFKIAFLLLFIFILPRAAFALLAQEMTQQSILKAAQEEVEQLKKMVEHQKNMLAHLDSSTVNDINSKRNTIIKNFEDVRSIITRAGAVTHLMSNFDSAYANRHPDWKNGMKISELKQRNDDRDKGMKDTFMSYIRGLNLGIADFKNDDALRSKLMDLLKNPKGQTQAIQGLGALLDHANLMLVRSENTIQSFMTTFLEYERDNIDKREQKGKSIIEACGGLKSHKPTAKAYNLGL